MAKYAKCTHCGRREQRIGYFSREPVCKRCYRFEKKTGILEKILKKTSGYGDIQKKYNRLMDKWDAHKDYDFPNLSSPCHRCGLNPATRHNDQYTIICTPCWKEIT